MQESFLRALQHRRAQIRARWETFLRIEKVSSPLANPDTLVFLFDHTLDEIFAALREVPGDSQEVLPAQADKKNPLLAYFVAGQQALLESLVLAQVEDRGMDPAARDADVAHLRQVMHRIARRDIESLEGVLQFGKSAGV